MLILVVHILITRSEMCNRIGIYSAVHTAHTLQSMELEIASLTEAISNRRHVEYATKQLILVVVLPPFDCWYRGFESR